MFKDLTGLLYLVLPILGPFLGKVKGRLRWITLLRVFLDGVFLDVLVPIASKLPLKSD